MSYVRAVTDIYIDRERDVWIELDGVPHLLNVSAFNQDASLDNIGVTDREAVSLTFGPLQTVLVNGTDGWDDLKVEIAE